MSLRRIDLNLFRVFEAVLAQGSIVGASRVLSVTPSAVSHAIARLREALGDPLFVATDQGMKPTPRALELAPHVQGGLQRIDLALNAQEFAPDTAVRTFHMAMSDLSAGVVLPLLVKRLQHEAPGIDLRIFPFDRSDTIRQIDDGRLDAVIGWFTTLPPRMRRRLLWRDEESIVVRPGHPLVGQPIDRDALLRYPHVVVELTGAGDGYDDGFVEDRGAVRRVRLERLLLDTRRDGEEVVGRAAVSVPHFSSVVPIVAASDLVATLPASYAASAVAQGAVVHLPLPYEPIIGHLEIVWHERSDEDEALQWMVHCINEATSEMRVLAGALPVP
ncbi:LysR family transcriptional regulator [Luteimonas sp. BDR2-5]|uniref:LysR family transcriptional regulator n=1 Tax=Proluteimonas luteida TaxID=2878685 RepID=UPI001E2F7CE7|nr:LysR family transcriptional regulator [Luteimonas sp. BDR2-5]MCD9026792.1 LysR family transcriptional regulator [Luteimonas sp. BDR2-5]